VEREGKKVELTLKPVMQSDVPGGETRPVVGVVWGGQTTSRSIPLYMAPVEGVKRTWEVTALTFQVVGRLLTGQGSKDDVGGPIAIADMAGQALRAGFLEFFMLMAILSVNLAVLNLLPVPVLDGGHLFFFVIEAVTGRPVNRRYREIAQQIGMILLLSLIVFMLYNDIMRIRVR
jgi:regulator of sigma E protease